ncbi:MAG: ComF family protein [Desulfobacterales bacterium]
MMGIKTFAALSAQAAVEALFPLKCLVCGSLYHRDAGSAHAAAESAKTDETVRRKALFCQLMAPYVCPACMLDFTPISAPLCPKCGVMFETRSGENHLCGECLKTERVYGIARSLGEYESVLMAAIHCLKYRAKARLAGPLGKLLFMVLVTCWDVGDIDVVVPVPLHARKMRKRGFNQSALLVRNWPEWAAGLAGCRTLSVDTRSVIRQRQTISQTGLSKRDRMENVKHAFYVNTPAGVGDKRVLLVDDVYTTGATVSECAKVLKKAGAVNVDVLTLARTG